MVAAVPYGDHPLGEQQDLQQPATSGGGVGAGKGLLRRHDGGNGSGDGNGSGSSASTDSRGGNGNHGRVLLSNGDGGGGGVPVHAGQPSLVVTFLVSEHELGPDEWLAVVGGVRGLGHGLCVGG